MKKSIRALKSRNRTSPFISALDVVPDGIIRWLQLIRDYSVPSSSGLSVGR